MGSSGPSACTGSLVPPTPGISSLAWGCTSGEQSTAFTGTASITYGADRAARVREPFSVRSFLRRRQIKKAVANRPIAATPSAIIRPVYRVPVSAANAALLDSGGNLGDGIDGMPALGLDGERIGGGGGATTCRSVIVGWLIERTWIPRLADSDPGDVSLNCVAVDAARLELSCSTATRTSTLPAATLSSRWIKGTFR